MSYLNDYQTRTGTTDPWRARMELARSGVTGYEGELGGGKTVDQWQQEMNAYAQQRGIRAPNLSQQGFEDLRYSDDPLNDWIRTQVGTQTMLGNANQWNTNQQATTGGTFQLPVSQEQANANNHWGSLANQTNAGNQSWNVNSNTGRPNTEGAFVSQNAPPINPGATNSMAPSGLQNGFSFGGDTNPMAAPAGGDNTTAKPMAMGAGGGNLGFGGGNGAANSYQPQQNPYLPAMGQAIVDQSNQNLNNNIMPGIRSGAQAAGQYGGSRQGIAEGVAAGQATTGIAGALSQLYGNAYNTDQSNLTARIGQANQYDLGLGQLGLGAGQLGLADRTANQNYGLGLGQLGLANRNSDQNFALGAGQLGLNSNTAQQNFYTAQRGQDLQQYGLGANLFQSGVQGNLGIGAGQYGLGQSGMNAPMDAAGRYSNFISPYSGLNSTQAVQQAPQSNVAMAGLGGAMAGYQLYNNFNNQPTTYGNSGATGNLTGQGTSQGWM